MNPRSCRRFSECGLAAQVACWVVSSILLAGCASTSLKKELIRDPPSYASSPAIDGPLAALAEEIENEHGPEWSGFKLLDASYDSLLWRLALIDSATTSLDVQTYLWYPDHSGRLVLDRVLRAADRGVRVRLIVDDLLTLGQDQTMVELQRRPNVELRLFNPWRHRGTLRRVGEMIAKMERLNTRMHDKLLIADGCAMIIGGRNIGDHYFGLSEAYSFHDLDVLGFGYLAQQGAAMFDSFWNSEWVVSAANIDRQHDAEAFEQRIERLEEQVRNAPELSAFPRQPQDWLEQLREMRDELHPGTSSVVYDEATGDEVAQNVGAHMFGAMGMAQEELLITNAYIIPGQPGIDFIRKLTGRGVRVRILTNSLASHDVPAVNSHYKKWRDDLLEAGAELYELRADAAIQDLVDVPPVQGHFVGLHTKAFVVDRRLSFIGSMNFDPRSFNINTEGGIFIESPGLADALAQLMERDIEPENAWQVLLDDKGRPYWVNSDETVRKQPARSGSQRVMDKIFMMFPKGQY